MGPSFVGTAEAAAQGLLLVGDIGFEDYHTPESFLHSPEKDIRLTYRFQNVARLADVLKKQELQNVTEEEHP